MRPVYMSKPERHHTSRHNAASNTTDGHHKTNTTKGGVRHHGKSSRMLQQGEGMHQCASRRLTGYTPLSVWQT